ncbi:MAG: hypothetical protein JWN56_1542 [Sphingobacteriales bacterium]|nr:hypothetical protein [Sphingobacteriales bacterium]
MFTMDKFIGTNAFVDDPINKLQAVGFIREYHNWEWNERGVDYKGYPNNKITWTPEDWNFDTFYKNINDAGLTVSPCIQGNVKWLNLGIYKNSEKPVDEAISSPDQAVSYQKKSHFMYQFAARYGSTQVADKKLTLADDQKRASGMNLVHYLEDWNEQDKDWEGTKSSFTAQEYAAMASADYDGHGNTMRMGTGTFGMKNADPNIKFVLGGLAFLKLDYIKDMKTWFEENRLDKKFAADVINFHVYGWKTEKGWKGGGPAMSPEQSNFKERLEEITQYRDKHLPRVEVWVSEFGWDTNADSPLAPPVIGSFDIQEVQAQWLVRGYLAFAAAGVDRAQMYMFRDVDGASANWFASCGLVGPKGDWTPKKSWYYIYTLKNTLKNMVYSGEKPSGNRNVLIYKFKEADTQKQVYAVWARTSSAYNVKGFKIKLNDIFSTAQLISLIPGRIEGKVSTLNLKNNEVTVDVSERPVFIKLAK